MGIEIDKAVTVCTVCILGIAIGSFLNVCIFRIPIGKSVIFPPSACQRCGHRLGWWENIPLFSYMFLKGRCYSCDAPYSAQYPAVEFLAGVVVAANYFLFHGITADMVLYSIFGFVLIVISFIDWRYYWIPDKVILIGAALGIAGSLVSDTLDWKMSCMGGLAGGVSMIGLGLIGYAVHRKESLGGGDIKLMIMVGIYLGWRLTLLSIFWGALAALCVYILLVIMKRKRPHWIVPFGSFLAMGSMAAVWVGNRVLDWYLHLVW